MLPSTDKENYPSGLVKIHSIEVEKYDKHYDFKPDVEGIMENGERLLIELYVSHRVKDKKHQTIVKNNLKCVEIDINNQSLYKPKLKEFLVGTSKNRKWILPKSNIPKEESDADFYSKTRNPLYEAARDALKEIFDKGTLIIHPFYGVSGHIDEPFNLRKYKYDICEVGTDYNKFKSDLLIYRSQEKDKGHISINFRGSRRLENFDAPPGLRVIDVVIKSYASIKKLKGLWEKGGLIGSNSVSIYCMGFNSTPRNQAGPYDKHSQSIIVEDSNKSSNSKEQENFLTTEAKRRAKEYVKSKQWP